MKEYEVFVPLKYNDGSPVHPRVFQHIQRELVAQFGGLTFYPPAQRGVLGHG